jgi:hypothetical protein
MRIALIGPLFIGMPPTFRGGTEISNSQPAARLRRFRPPVAWSVPAERYSTLFDVRVI